MEKQDQNVKLAEDFGRPLGWEGAYISLKGVFYFIKTS